MSSRIKFSINALLNAIKKTSPSIMGMEKFQQKSRTTPIEDSIEAVPGYPVQIYLIPASKHYQARTVGRRDGTRPRISLKTESRATAIRAAKEWYDNLLVKQRNGENLVASPNFKTVAEAMFKDDQGRVDRGEHSAKTLNNDKSIYNSALVHHFGGSYCKDINYAKVQGYIDWINMRPGKKPLATKTLRNHLIVLSKVLHHAVRLGYMTAKPEFPKLTQADNPRGWLTDAEYMDVRKAIHTMIAKGTKVRYVPVTEELQLLTSFMLHTYLRPGDLPLLKHKHIQLKQTDKGNSYLKIYATSKTDDRHAVAVSREAVAVEPLAIDDERDALLER
jgi:hypothetical protein